MMRYFYSICFLVIGTALPVLAKNKGNDCPTPSTSSKAGSKGIPFSSAKPESSVAQAKEQIHKNTEVIVTPDVSRGMMVSASSPAKPQASPSTSTPTEHRQARTVSEVSPAPIRNTTTVIYGGGSVGPTPKHDWPE
jgi:hypothetical protein